MLPELTGEHVASARADTKRVRHDESILVDEESKQTESCESSLIICVQLHSE
jgi:hypothetical protein